MDMKYYLKDVGYESGSKSGLSRGITHRTAKKSAIYCCTYTG